MSDEVIAKDSGQQFTPHPEGQFVAVCVDVVNLGERVRDFQGHVKIQPSCAIVFATGERREDNELLTVSAEFNVSMHEQAALRKFLESWRAKAYTPEQLKAGVPLKVLTGQPCLLTVEHVVSSKTGRVYAKPGLPVLLPKKMHDEIPVVNDYKRAGFWEDRKASYAAEVAKLHGPDIVADNGASGFEDEEIPF